MEKTINFLVPELSFGSFGMAKCTVEIVENGVSTQSRTYYFNVNEFSAYVDSVAVNYASVHFGSHVVNLSNGDYTKVLYNGGVVSNPYTAIYQLAEAVSSLA